MVAALCLLLSFSGNVAPGGLFIGFKARKTRQDPAGNMVGSHGNPARFAQALGLN